MASNHPQQNSNQISNYPSTYHIQNPPFQYFPTYFYLPHFQIPPHPNHNYALNDPKSYPLPPTFSGVNQNPTKTQKELEKIEQPVEEGKNLKSKVLVCRCTKSHCRKEYCFCYKNGISCNEKCVCVGCKNTEDSLNIKHDFKKISAVTCNCLKSKCEKKYCECFAAGKKCGEHCNCKECRN